MSPLSIVSKCPTQPSHLSVSTQQPAGSNHTLGIIDYIKQNHLGDVYKCIFQAQKQHELMRAKKHHYFLGLQLDSMLFLDSCPIIGTQLLNGSRPDIQDEFVVAAHSIISDILKNEQIHPEYIRCIARMAYWPAPR
ncbi:hypothetical protein MT418_005372 [Batrachochytrium dendrobatidis]